MSSTKSGFAVTLATVAALTLAAGTARADDGLLGIFFDTSGSECSGDIPTASFASLYVLLLPSGSTYGGVVGAEFRIEPPGGGAFLFSGERAASGAVAAIGSAFGGGINIAFGSCQSGSSVPFLAFQVFSTGTPMSDAVLRVTAKTSPSNPAYNCPLVVLCDPSTYTEVCVEGGVAVLNPTGQRPCGSSRIDSQWSRVKDLYRP